MSSSAALLLTLTLAAAPTRAPAPRALECGPFTCRQFDTPQRAFAAVLEAQPLVLGIGEYHELQGGPRIPSAIKRFTRSLLPLLKGRAADLVAETWITNGRCGKVEQQATEQIEKTTERPKETEDEVVTMLRTSGQLGVQPHILTVECDEYLALFDEAGEVDNVRLLELVTRLLREKTEEILEKLGPANQKAVVLYGGALHNDLTPSEALADFSFGPDLKRVTGGRYVQLGLYVPEFMERDDEARKAPWFPFFEKHASRTRTLLITLSPDAHLLIFPRTAAATKPKPAR